MNWFSDAEIIITCCRKIPFIWKRMREGRSGDDVECFEHGCRGQRGVHGIATWITGTVGEQQYGLNGKGSMEQMRVGSCGATVS